MSIWTHVAGIIRVDHIPSLANEDVLDLTPDKELDFDTIMGKELRWEDDSDIWEDAEKHPEKYMPYGCEGSLQKSVWVNPHDSYVARYTVSIFGDLRCHDDVDGVIEWFKSVCSKVWVRNATIVVENDLVGTRTWTYVEQEEEDEADN